MSYEKIELAIILIMVDETKVSVYHFKAYPNCSIELKEVKEEYFSFLRHKKSYLY